MNTYCLIVCLTIAAGGFVQGCSVLDDFINQPLPHRRRRDTHKPFSYSNTEAWKTAFAADCSLSQQSPIDIRLDSCTPPADDATPLRITGWDVKPTSTFLKRTGKTIEFWSRYGEKRPMLTGGVLGSDIYGFYQFHFHWGADKNEGAEHLIEGLHLPLEVHFIFVNEKYKSLSEALHKKDGLAVIGRFYEDSATAMAPVFSQYLVQLQQSQVVDAQKGISLAEIAPGTDFDYVSYKGSLTTPPCLEIVTWVVGVSKNMQVSDDMVDLFRKLSNEERVCRKVQPMNGRTLTCNIV